MKTPPDSSRYPLLSKLKLPDDIKRLSKSGLVALCAEARAYLIESLSQTGGHVASNLGVVELTAAIEACFDTSRDRLVFDVGHQCYVHKIFTGRLPEFQTLRSKGGISGFPKPSESRYDAFIAGHGSTAISVALGMARAEQLKPPSKRRRIVALVGDGAMSGGLAYEGLNDAGASGLPLIIILNDNGMSIGRSVGALSRQLTRFRTKTKYLSAKKLYHQVVEVMPFGEPINRFLTNVKDGIKHSILPGSFFESMGFEYIGPVDGHDVAELCEILSRAKAFDKPVIVHVVTQKGRGYVFSEGCPESFHGVDGFNIDTGERICACGSTYAKVFGDELTDLASRNPKIVAITAAMQAGVGLGEFEKRYPNRYFDVGIAEEHAVTMAAGMAARGLKPFIAIYSTFLQRAFDEIWHDIGIMSLPAVFCVDRSGLVGEDGETHQGIYDMAMFRAIPGMRVFMPSGEAELRSMLRAAAADTSGPCAIRYSRGAPAAFSRDTSSVPALLLRSGGDITLVGSGRLIDALLDAAELLSAKGVSASVLKLNRIHPIEKSVIYPLLDNTVLVAEEHADFGSTGDAISAAMIGSGYKIYKQNCGCRYIPQAAAAEQLDMCGLTAPKIAERALKVLSL